MPTPLRPLAFLLLLAAPLAAQSNAERITNDQYTRSHDYDLLHQRIELSHFDWDSLSLDGRVTTTLRALRSAFDSVLLDAGAGLEVQSVVAISPRGVPGAALRFEHPGDTLVVHLPKPVAFGDTVRFAVAYHARIENGQGLTFIAADTLPPRRPRQIWSQGETDGNHQWFPTYDFPNDKATWEVIATVPRGDMAVSNGRLVRDRFNRDGTRTLHWSQDQRSATYLVSLIVEPLVRVPNRWRGIPVDAYVYPGDSAAAARLFRTTPDMIETYSRLTGVNYPWRKYAQTTVADFFGGMENVSATTLVDWLPDSRAWADRPWYHHILIPHELAHQWFGDYVTTANWANMWLNEGFAEFMPGQYWATKGGRHLGEDYYLDEYTQFMQIDHRRRMPLAADGSNNIYPKGALVLEMLRKHLGDDRFWAGIHRYLTDHALDVAVTDDLRQAFLAATGENLDVFWRQWIYQAGYPEFHVTDQWDSTTSMLTLTVRQTQQDSTPGDTTADSTALHYTTPPVFHMPVTVRVATPAGETTVRAPLDQREQEIRVPGITQAPTMVIFDDGNTILKTLTFDQSTDRLAAQLARDPDLWNRWWVIGQLRARKTDSTAEAALARAATGADYFLTRVEAADALADFSGPAGQDALLAALRDTSAQVRAAALGSLASYPGPSVHAAVEGEWTRDTSYAARAAALGALGRLDPGRIHALARLGLQTWSYQDAIADAALSLVAQANDTTLMDEVDAAVETTGNAAFVLGVFAARGNTRALDLLGRHVLSPRAAVRRRALQAFRFVVPPAMARGRLTELKDQAGPVIAGEIDGTLRRLKS